MTGYERKIVPGHPRADLWGRVEAHILAAEEVLGKYISSSHPVHHVDTNKRNNDPINLVVCEDKSYHMLLHKRATALKECGNADWERCMYCRRFDSPEKLERREYSFMHLVCRNSYYRWRRKKKPTIQQWRKANGLV